MSETSLPKCGSDAYHYITRIIENVLEQTEQTVLKLKARRDDTIIETRDKIVRLGDVTAPKDDAFPVILQSPLNKLVSSAEHSEKNDAETPSSVTSTAFCDTVSNVPRQLADLMCFPEDPQNQNLRFTDRIFKSVDHKSLMLIREYDSPNLSQKQQIEDRFSLQQSKFSDSPRQRQRNFNASHQQHVENKDQHRFQLSKLNQQQYKFNKRDQQQAIELKTSRMQQQPDIKKFSHKNEFSSSYPSNSFSSPSTSVSSPMTTNYFDSPDPSQKDDKGNEDGGSAEFHSEDNNEDDDVTQKQREQRQYEEMRDPKSEKLSGTFSNTQKSAGSRFSPNTSETSIQRHKNRSISDKRKIGRGMKSYSSAEQKPVALKQTKYREAAATLRRKSSNLACENEAEECEPTDEESVTLKQKVKAESLGKAQQVGVGGGERMLTIQPRHSLPHPTASKHILSPVTMLDSAGRQKIVMKGWKPHFKVKKIWWQDLPKK